MIWGLVISFLGVFAIAASLAEICSVLPTSGGPYHWSFVLAPKGWERGISYTVGWLNTAGKLLDFPPPSTLSLTLPPSLFRPLCFSFDLSFLLSRLGLPCSNDFESRFFIYHWDYSAPSLKLWGWIMAHLSHLHNLCNWRMAYQRICGQVVGSN